MAAGLLFLVIIRVRKKPSQKWLYKSQYLSGFVLYKKGEENTIVFSATEKLSTIASNAYV
jgi:hypothetical protein